MTLNETQSAAVCQAFCCIQKFIDAASDAAFENPYGCISCRGSLFLCVDGFNAFTLRDVKDRSPKEIDDFVSGAIDKLQDFRTANRKAKIEDLRAQLAAIEAEQFSADRIAELKEEPIELEPEEKWTDR